MSTENQDIKSILQEKSDFTEEEFDSLIENHGFTDKGASIDIKTTKDFGDVLSIDPVKKIYAWGEEETLEEKEDVEQEKEQNTEFDPKEGITSKTDISKILRENERERKRRNVCTPQALETINGKVFFDSPFIAQQHKKLPKSTRVRQKVIKVFDMSVPEQLDEFNQLLNNYISDFSTIGNFTYQLQTFETANTWKALVMYDILEFQNPLNR